MYTSKRGQNAPRGQIVKTKPNRRVIAIAIALALVGTITYVFAYQYTHSAKLEVELNNKESQLQKIQQLHQDSLNSSEQEQKQLEDKIKQLEADLQAKKEREAQSIAFATKQAQASSVKVTGTKADWLRAAGIPESQWQYVDYIVGRESGWRYLAVNKSSGATGLCQSLPARKMASAGSDYMTNPVTQLRWCNSYAVSRYGGWSQAYSFWIAKHWW